jgi:Leucine-rich repeat (LRR) protein
LLIFALDLLDISAQLYLEGNKLSGPIPREFGNMENLRNLSLANNQLTGPIPPDLSRLQDLQQCHLGGNSLEGPVPEEICSLDIPQLEVDSYVQCSCCIGDT